MASLKQLAAQEEKFKGGHRACAGCAATIAARMVLIAAEQPVVVGAATGCLEVVSTIYPYSAWNVPYVHNAFENVAATMSGVEAAYRALKKKGMVKKDLRFIAFGGDGGTYDIGLQALSGMIERRHHVLPVTLVARHDHGQRVALLDPELPADVGRDVLGLESGRAEDPNRFG